MRARATALIILGLALALGGAVPAEGQHPLLALPLGDPGYRQLDGLARLGCGAARVSAFRPFMVRDIRRALRAAAGERACAGPLLDALGKRFLPEPAPADSLADPRVTLGGALTVAGTALSRGEFEPLWRDVRPEGEGDPPIRGIAALRFTWTGGSKLLAIAEAYAETDRRNDPTVRAGTFRNTDAAIDFSEASLTGELGPLILSIGRGHEAWTGDGEESLVLSANGPALDRIALQAKWARVEFRALVATANDVVLTPAADGTPDSLGSQRWHRMLIAHALTLRPSRHVELTIGETGLVPRQGGGIDLQYVNPLMIYQVTQEDSARDTDRPGNTNLTAFGSVRANAGRFAAQGELLIDDIQIDAKDRRVFPDLLGWNVLASCALPVPAPADLTVQYRRLGSYTYFGRAYTDTWQYYNEPVGSELGPDADLMRVGADVWPAGRLHLGVGISHWRHGALRIDQRPSADRTGHAGDPFPSTTPSRPEVQRAWLADLSGEWLDPVLAVTLHVQAARIANVNNLPAPGRMYGKLQVVGTYRFRYP
jgi:hypothetical protein